LKAPFLAFRLFKYLWAFPSIQIGNENLKFGYAIAQVLLKIPSIASCGHEPFYQKNHFKVKELGVAGERKNSIQDVVET